MRNHPSSLPAENPGRLILVLAMLAAFAPLATDMYLPGFAQMAAAYNTDPGRIEATLSTFFLGLALGQAIYGPIIDRFGRKAPLLVGIALFALATLGCLLTRDIDVFTGLRFMQAMGGCAGMIVGRAILNDLYEPAESARALSLIITLMIVAPVFAPLLGGWILVTAGWQAIFILLLAFAALCGALTWRYIPETLPRDRRQPLNVSSLLRAYRTLVRQPGFLVPALVGGLAQVSIFAFITGSPFVFMEYFGLSEQQYGLVFGLTALGIAVGAQLNRAALRRFSVRTLLRAALWFQLGAGIVLLACAGTTHVFVLIPPLWLIIASLGFIGSNAAAIAMSKTGPYAGTGSAMIGVLQFGCAFAVSGLIAAAPNGTPYPMAIAIVTAALAANILWFLGSRRGNR